MAESLTIDILVVDDSRGDRRLIQEALKEVQLPAHFRLHDAGDGHEALQLLGERPGREADCLIPHLIILDLNMPRMDGKEFLGLVKDSEKFGEIPVIVLTTSAAEADVQAAYRLKANCYVTKPMDMVEFIDTVQRLADFWLSVVMPKKSA